MEKYLEDVVLDIAEKPRVGDKLSGHDGESNIFVWYVGCGDVHYVENNVLPRFVSIDRWESMLLTGIYIDSIGSATRGG